MEDCLLASEAQQPRPQGARLVPQNAGLQAYDRRTHRLPAQPRRARGRRTGQVQARLVTIPGELTRTASPRRSTADGLLWTPVRRRRRDDRARRHRADLRHRAPGGAARRAAPAHLPARLPPDQHPDGRAPLRARGRVRGPARHRAGLRPLLRDRDDRPFAGALAGEVWGVEIVDDAIADAIHNARAERDLEHPLPRRRRRTSVRPLVEKAGTPDLVVVDPPRAGLSKKIVRRMIECGAQRIVYVSCNPTTLAPNAAQLVEAGYRLRRVRAGRHVPADAAHRVRRAAGARLTYDQPALPPHRSVHVPSLTHARPRGPRRAGLLDLHGLRRSRRRRDARPSRSCSTTRPPAFRRALLPPQLRAESQHAHVRPTRTTCCAATCTSREA